MLVSVLIRTIGSESLRVAIDSVLSQTYTNYEIIIVEDGSSKAEKLILSYNNDKIKYFSLAKVGRSAVGNKAMELANGDYCIFLDDDDEYYENHLELLVSEAINNPGKIIYSDADECGMNDSRTICSAKYRFPRQEENILLGNFLIINNVLFPKEAYQKLGGFEENVGYLEDWILWARYLSQYGIIKVNKVTSCYYTPLSLSKYFARIKNFKKNYKYAYDIVTKFTVNNVKTQESCLQKIIRRLRIAAVLTISRLFIRPCKK